jgi:hypothetical protein
MVRLARLGPSAGEAIPGLTNHLQDEDPFVRAHAARAAFRVGVSAQVVVPVLADLLQPEEPQLCCLASLILGEIGSNARAALPVLRGCMKSRDASIRLHAAEAMLKIDSTDWTALRELMAGTEDNAVDLRYFAINALGEAALDNEQALFALHRALTDEDMTVAIAAALNLSKRFHLPSGAASNTPEKDELSRLIDNLRDPLPANRKTAAIRLGLAGPAARRAGIALLDRLTDPDLSVRVHVAHALWQIERPAGAVVPVLVDLLGVAKSNTRIAATFVLGEIGPAAGDALPALYDMFAGSRLRDRLLLSMVISLIEPRDREMIGILVGGLLEQAGDVRYQSAIALGSAPVAHQRRVEKALTQAGDDRNLRVQAAAAEALSRYELRIYEARHALSAQYVSSFGSLEAVPAKSTSIIEAAPDAESSSADEADDTGTSTVTDSVTDSDASQRDSMPPIGDLAQSVDPRKTLEGYDDPDPDGGLKSIRKVRASIRWSVGQDPPDFAFARFAGEPGRFQSLGATRGWSPITYGWDAPAMYYSPVYFEDVNLERYGIHYGLVSPFISFGKFFGGFPVLPYKLIVQPMCENSYTLGFERPNNCVPVHCFGWGLPKTSLLWWFSRHNYNPIRATWPWECGYRPCNTECSTYCDPDGETNYESEGETVYEASYETNSDTGDE